jgi:hypothetical protein
MADSLTAPVILNIAKVMTGQLPATRKTARVMVGAPAGTQVEVDAQGTYQIFSVPAGAVILDVRTRVVTGFTASVTITLGDGVNAAGYLDSTEIAPTSAETAGVYKSCVLQANTYSAGKKYLTADTIDAVIAGAVPAAGLLEVLIDYLDATAGAA